MFLNSTKRRNPALLETAFQMHQTGVIQPDTYVIDLDAFLANAAQILQEAKAQEIQLYFMLKQVGRNPMLAKRLVKLGYRGAVVVDYKEAALMMKHQIPLGHVGHLVQIPKHQLKDIIAYGCEIMTAYTLEKIREINQAAKELQVIQPIMLRVCKADDLLYSGQLAGFHLDELTEVVKEVQQLSHVRLSGVTAFPCFLYQEDSQEIQPTANLATVLQAADLLRGLGCVITQINTPSTTCSATLKLMKQSGATHGEPGHGFTGTTPAHVKEDLIEKPAVVYVSEVSHTYDGVSYCYGGGLYRRSHMENALVGTSMQECKHFSVLWPNLDNIDYHLGLQGNCHVSDTVLMSFRFQIFVTRSDVVIVKGISTNQPEIAGRYDALGKEL